MEQLSQPSEMENILSKIESTYLEIFKEMEEKLKLINRKLDKPKTLSDERQKSKSTKMKTHPESELTERNHRNKIDEEIESVLSQNASLEAETNSMRIEIGHLKCELHQVLGLNTELNKELQNWRWKFSDLKNHIHDLIGQLIDEREKKNELEEIKSEFYSLMSCK